MRGRGGKSEYRWAKKTNPEPLESEEIHTSSRSSMNSSVSRNACTSSDKVMEHGESSLRTFPVEGEKAVWKLKNPHGTTECVNRIQEVRTEMSSLDVNTHGETSLQKGLLPEKDYSKPSIFSHMQIRAAYYPKFKTQKSENETRYQMLDTVSKGLACLEVSLKHSGCLFMYSGHKSGAYAKNNYGNIHTAIGIFVLGRMFQEVWGNEVKKKQMEFNEYLERNHICVCMKLVTAVMHDYGQRAREDYVVVTAVVQLGSQKPQFYSTMDKITFCRLWRLPTNNVWLFLTRNSVTRFFAAYDALREEATATLLCKVLDDIADLSFPGSVDFIKVQGEILEGLVVRLVNNVSLANLEKVMDSHLSLCGGVDLGPSLREVCAANRSDEKQQIRALLHSVGTSFCPDYRDWFRDGADDSYPRKTDVSVLSDILEAHPIDEPTAKLKELCNLMRQKPYAASFKFYDIGRSGSLSSGTCHYKMAVYGNNDSSFKKFQSEMRCNPELGPLYRGLFVDVCLFTSKSENNAEVTSNFDCSLQNAKGRFWTSGEDIIANDEAHLMIVFKFLTYELRTSLMRDGLAVLLDGDHGAYKAYYLRKMQSWRTSSEKQWALSKMLDEWAVYIRRKYTCGKVSSSAYLTVAEPFLQRYAERDLENDALIGSSGHFVKAEDFLAITEELIDNFNTVKIDQDAELLSWNPAIECSLAKKETLIIFFVGIPGSTKSGICREILNSPQGLEDGRQISSIMGTSVRGRYWKKIAEECRMNPSRILLADKNAPNEEVWWQIEDICKSANVSAVPVVPDSEGTDSNPFSLEALSVFTSRVIQRDYHPGKLDRSSPRAGYVMLNFYHIYEGKGRKQFELELVRRFGSLVKIPLLKARRKPIPEAVHSVFKRGIDLYKRHYERHGCSVESTAGSYMKDWTRWENELQQTIFDNADYLNNIQVPFEVSVKRVMAQLKAIATGKYTLSYNEKRDSGPISFAAVSLSSVDILNILDNLGTTNKELVSLLGYKHPELMNPYILLAHKRTHGVTAVASYAPIIREKVAVELTAVLVSSSTLAMEVVLGTVGGERLTSKDEWPHATLWIGRDEASEADVLPQLLAESRADRVDVIPPVNVQGTIQFF